jgi:hypothetical protein
MNLNQEREYNTLEYYRQFPEEILTKGGVYYWVYWPFRDNDIEYIHINKFKENINKFSRTNINLPEYAKTGYKFSVEVQEIRFGEKPFFGLNDRKKDDLIIYLEQSEANRKQFLIFLKKIAFNRPFYIGKADNLRTRLVKHFNSQSSDILKYLSEYEIQDKDVLIGYEIADSNDDLKINVILEEIAQRLVKPGLTKRPG